MSMILKTIILSILGGIVYRMGGSGNYPRYFRELGQGIFACAEMACLGFVQWYLILCFGICWAESTYFKKKGTDAKAVNWALVGGIFGLVPIPFCIATNSHWVGFSIRMVACVSMTVFWQEFLSETIAYSFRKTLHKDVTDEFGRGFINIATLPLLLIGA